MRFLVWIAALGLSCLPNLSVAQVALNFDDLAAGPVSTQYAARGATFNFPMVRDYSHMPGFVRSGAKAIELCFAIEFCTAPLAVDFTAGQSRVKVFVGYTLPLDQSRRLLLRAFDQNGTLVRQTSALLRSSSVPTPVQVPLEVTSSSANIRKVIVDFALSSALSNNLVFDDLEFDVAGPAPACTATANPTVALSMPSANSTVQINEFTLRGTVTTGAPLEQATLTVSAFGNSRTSNMLGTLVQPTGGPFGPTRIDGSLFPSFNTVTVAVRNCRGTGQASANVIYAPVPDGTVVRLLGMEVTQATQDTDNSVPLVAGKPAAIRLYFSTTDSTIIQKVRADITGFHHGASLPFFIQSRGTTDIDASQDLSAKRLDLTKSLNFELPPQMLGHGSLHFWVVRLNVEGPGGATLVCEGCDHWHADFRRARPLDLIVVPFRYALPHIDPDLIKTADRGAGLMNGLNWLNKLYPLSGNFPLDPSGINLTILPTRTTKLNLPERGGEFLTRLQGTLNLLHFGFDFPPDTRLLGIVPFGMGGLARGHVTYADARAIQDQAGAGDAEFYGQIWAHEIGHSLGRRHVGTHNEMPPVDPAFPYPHGGIGEPGLIIGPDGWSVVDPGNPATGAPHAHDFMSYGHQTPEHTKFWVAPFTYRALANIFLPPGLSEARARPPAVEKLVITGYVGADDAAILRPFHVVTTAFATGSGVEGDFSVDLIDGSGRILLTHRFRAIADSQATSLGFNEFVPWKTETRRIVLKRDNTALAERMVSPNKPSVRVTKPERGETWGKTATIAWEAGDRDGDALTFTVLYNSGLDERWVPLATDVTERSISVDTALLVGSTRAGIRVRATDGVNTTEADSGGTFTLPDNPPLVAILGTTSGQGLPQQRAKFTGAAYDPRDGMLPAARLSWSSDRDGRLGNGPQIETIRPLSGGAHIITLTATNSQGRSANSRMSIMVR